MECSSVTEVWWIAGSVPVMCPPKGEVNTQGLSDGGGIILMKRGKRGKYYLQCFYQLAQSGTFLFLRNYF